MKKIVTVGLMLFVVTMLFAQSVDVRINRTYIVKSTDGSG